MTESYESLVNTAFGKFDFDLVVYDEVEYFRDYTNKLFNYPYQPRKNKLTTFNFDADPNAIADDGGYVYSQMQLRFQQS